MKTMLTFTSVALVGMLAAAPARAQQPKTIVDTAVTAGSFTTLAKALTAADLVTTLKGPGPFTVFAPTDEAFAKLPAGTLESLLKPENKDKLRRILMYHVVAGEVNREPVESVRDRRARRTAPRVVGPEHEMINEQLRTTAEKISQRRFPVIGLEFVLLVDLYPGQLLPFFRPLITPVCQILFGFEQLLAGRQPFFTRSSFVFCHS